jgi:AraC-like DNA-binding protein
MSQIARRRLHVLPTATGGIARNAYACARRSGIAVKPLVRKVGLTERQINDPRTRIAVRQQIDFLNLVAAALADEFLGFHLAELFDLRELGLLHYVAASSETLADALQRTARYSSIVNEGLSLRYLEGRDVRMVFEYVGVARHRDRHQLEFFMTALVRVCRHLTKRRVTPSRVRITHRRLKNGESPLIAYFGRNITFGAKADELTFIGRTKHEKIVSADPYLNEILVAHAEQALLHRPARSGACRAAVENAIVPLLPHGMAHAPRIAAKLHLSGRTLARRLASEGVTYSDVLEKLRIDLARQYLSHPDLSISRIAWLLGYREVSAFTHAYKRWSGTTPSVARARGFALVSSSRVGVRRASSN